MRRRGTRRKDVFSLCSIILMNAWHLLIKTIIMCLCVCEKHRQNKNKSDISKWESYNLCVYFCWYDCVFCHCRCVCLMLRQGERKAVKREKIKTSLTFAQINNNLVVRSLFKYKTQTFKTSNWAKNTNFVNRLNSHKWRVLNVYTGKSQPKHAAKNS